MRWGVMTKDEELRQRETEGVEATRETMMTTEMIMKAKMDEGDEGDNDNRDTDLLPLAGGCEGRRQMKVGSTGIWSWCVWGGGGRSETQWESREKD